MKTYEELGIKQAEYNALITVRDMLDRHAAESEALFAGIDARWSALPNAANGHTINGLGVFNMSLPMVLPDADTIASMEDYGIKIKSSWHCGTVGCIGGWASLVMQDVITDNEHGPVNVDMYAANEASYFVRKHDERGSPLHELFYPYVIRASRWRDITPRIAVQAIDNFMTNGDPDWVSLLPEDAHDTLELQRRANGYYEEDE